MEEPDKKISEIVRSTVKDFMESLMRGEIQAFLEEREGQKTDIMRETFAPDMERSMI